MGSLLSWISDLVDFIRKFVPALFIVRATHRACKFKRGKHIVGLEPGLHIYWPLLTEVVIIAAARQSNNLPTQVILSEDGPIAASGVVVYRVRDPARALGRSWDLDVTVSDLALTRILRELVGKPISGIVNELKTGALTERLTKGLRKDLVPYGVAVETCALTDFSPTQVLKVLGGGGIAPVTLED